jgi:hypothetical protein
MALFDLYVSGPPPGNATTGSEQWINLGTIPTGKRIWFGSSSYSSPNKSITFELRTSLTGKSASGTANTKLLMSSAVAPKSGAIKNDYYKNNTLHIVSVYSTGIECFWLRLVSKSSTAGSYLYTINYTLE